MNKMNKKREENLRHFKKGNPGGPGRGKTKNENVTLKQKVQKIVQSNDVSLDQDQLQKLIKFAYEQALDGRAAYAKLVFDKFIATSTKRMNSAALDNVKLKTVTDVADAMEAITNELRANTIDVETAVTLMNMYKMTGDFVRDTAIDVVKKAAEEMQEQVEK